MATIHDIWPNLTIYAHGGVSFEPYRKGFEKLFARPIIYVETYLASEGFLAYQSRPNTHAMKLVLNNGIFFEFVPFNEVNFSADGQLLENAETLVLSEIEEGKDYALLISTNAGTWRYLIGDTVRFTSKEHNEIIITGRTKHFLSLCGEHLSVDNMNMALKKVSEEQKLSIPEFTVAGVRHENLFAHHWYVGTNDTVDVPQFKKRLDEVLCEINDDYAVERQAALKEVLVTVLPLTVFHAWMEQKGKVGGQNKFPRVFRGEQLSDWQHFVKQNN